MLIDSLYIKIAFNIRINKYKKKRKSENANLKINKPYFLLNISSKFNRLHRTLPNFQQQAVFSLLILHSFGMVVNQYD
jgi:hypothetical protein